jgi:hypothetical protein
MSDITEILKQQALVLLDEALEEPTVPYRTFTDHEGLLPALSRLTAEAASVEKTPGDATSTVAAHCEHLRFSALVWRDWLRGSREPVDWSASWTVSRVDEASWKRLLSDLRSAFAMARESVSSCDATTPEAVGGILSVAAHTAYHIGAIRQKLP